MQVIPGNIILAAQKAYTKYGILPSIQIAQWALESGWGKHSPGNNPFGIKATSTQKGQSLKSNEQSADGTVYQAISKFRVFPSIDNAFDAHANLLANGKPYIGCRIYQADYHMYCIMMGKIYATDKDYANLLVEVIDHNKLTQYDKKWVDPKPVVAIIAAGAGAATMLAVTNTQPILHHFDYAKPLWFGIGLVVGIACMILWAIVEHLKQRNTVVIRPEAQPIIDAVAALAAKAASADGNTQQISDLQAQVQDLTTKLAAATANDTDTDAALKAAAGMPA